MLVTEAAVDVCCVASHLVDWLPAELDAVTQGSTSRTNALSEGETRPDLGSCGRIRGAVGVFTLLG